MNKIRMIITSLVAVFAISAFAYDWESQKANAKTFFVNLNGSAPTAGQLTTNFVHVGDTIIDSFDYSVYTITSVSGGKYVKVASNGLVSVTGGATKNQGVVTNVSYTLQTAIGYDASNFAITNSLGEVMNILTNVVITPRFTTNSVASGILTNAP